MPQPRTWVYRYNYRVKWSPEDDQFIATCDEFPSLSWLADLPHMAVFGLEKLVSDVIVDLTNNEEFIPLPADNPT